MIKQILLITFILAGTICVYSQEFFKLELPEHFELADQESHFTDDGFGVLKLNGFIRVPNKGIHRIQKYYFINPLGNIFNEFSCMECILDYKGMSNSPQSTFILQEGTFAGNKGDFVLRFEKAEKGSPQMSGFANDKVLEDDEFFSSLMVKDQYYMFYKNDKTNAFKVVSMIDGRGVLLKEYSIPVNIYKEIKKSRSSIKSEESKKDLPPDNIFRNIKVDKDVVDFFDDKLFVFKTKYVKDTKIWSLFTIGTETKRLDIALPALTDYSDFELINGKIFFLKDVYEQYGGLSSVLIEILDMESGVLQERLTIDENSILKYKMTPFYSHDGDTIGVDSFKLKNKFSKYFNGYIKLEVKESNRGNWILTIVNRNSSSNYYGTTYNGAGGVTPIRSTTPESYHFFTMSLNKENLEPELDDAIYTPESKILQRKKQLDLRNKRCFDSYNSTQGYLSYYLKDSNQIRIDRF